MNIDFQVGQRIVAVQNGRELSVLGNVKAIGPRGWMVSREVVLTSSSFAGAELIFRYFSEEKVWRLCFEGPDDGELYFQKDSPTYRLEALH